ncbi:hypothetical protein SPLC1_S530760 [Arthrospira platensis C1]|nr:hypothetical protein SPLC1_S530760 [Arthrospira platensis C1]
MTELLESAIARLQTLSESQQNAILGSCNSLFIINY